ncbi:hypothetical protein LCGC14_0208090 [marine sediment metagenome]|uniref:Uncharacterized protein n=1 Tax=marine sediment metagenome TaxID=412755 RepID=A0A0F9XJS5_9ZZZZ
MPYITQDYRQEYDERLDDLCLVLDEHGYSAGHVTYVIYMIVARWFKSVPCYDTIASIRGVLLGTIAEFDRQKAAPYEDEKIEENGDVDLKYRTMEFDKGSIVEDCHCPIEIEPEEGDSDFDQCDCNKPAGIHSTSLHKPFKRGA